MRLLNFMFVLLFIPAVCLQAQKIGLTAPEKAPEVFPENMAGVDFIFSEGGFGLGTFYRRDITSTLTFFTDISMSEAKDEHEIEYIDYSTYYYGEVKTANKKNRVFLVPLNFGLQLRLFKESLASNLRPYISLGAGPSLVFTTPYEKEFFSSFSKAHANYTMGGYAGLGANFGLEKSSVLGISLRYYVIHFFDKGVESLENRYQKNLGGFFLTINLGTMF